MKTPRVKYEPSWDRKKLKPPPGGSLIIHPIVNVEHWVYSERMPRVVLPPPQGIEGVPDVPNWSWKEYGWRCGLPRIMGVLAGFGVRATASINGDVCNQYPRMAQAMNEAGWDFMGHGFVQRPMAAVEDERQVIAETKAALESFSGRKMRGWMGPGLSETFETADLLKEQGVEWTCDWTVDDLPVEVQTAHGPLVGVPYTLELNDIVVFAIEHHSSHEMYRRLLRSLPTYLEEIKENPRVLAISVHPYISGVPHRIGYYRRMFEKLARVPEVVFMTGSEITDWYLAQN
ncbi:MAG: polysaccharide deacetylase family protein [SAR324 cluster bacterium]|nr:polysaccharide deacetylase family protein [SAR324 cluster bacterium]